MKKLNKFYKYVGYAIGYILVLAMLAGSIWLMIWLTKAVFNLL